MSRECVWVLRWTEDADEVTLSHEEVPIDRGWGDFWTSHERLSSLRALWQTFAARVYCNRDLHADVFDAARERVCVDCHGSGQHTYNDSSCVTCHGSGQRECPSCLGVGLDDWAGGNCPLCKGSGVRL